MEIKPHISWFPAPTEPEAQPFKGKVEDFNAAHSNLTVRMSVQRRREVWDTRPGILGFKMHIGLLRLGKGWASPEVVLQKKLYFTIFLLDHSPTLYLPE